MIRVALVGDSHLTETSEHATMKLPPRLRAVEITVTTHARGGMNTRDALAQDPPADTDWIIYCLGTNDAAPWKRVPVDEFAANYTRLLQRSPNCDRLVLGPPPVRRQRGILVRTNRGIGRYSRTTERVARACGAHFLSLLELLDAEDLAGDGVHLRDAGYEKMAEAVRSVITGARTR